MQIALQKKSAIPKDCAEDPPKEEVLEEYVQRAPNTKLLCARRTRSATGNSENLLLRGIYFINL